MKIVWVADELSPREPTLSPKDIEAIAVVMRDQHGTNAEAFVRQQMDYYRANPVASATWKAVLAVLQ